jgi:hypothetical protein
VRSQQVQLLTCEESVLPRAPETDAARGCLLLRGLQLVIVASLYVCAAFSSLTVCVLRLNADRTGLRGLCRLLSQCVVCVSKAAPKARGVAGQAHHAGDGDAIRLPAFCAAGCFCSLIAHTENRPAGPGRYAAGTTGYPAGHPRAPAGMHELGLCVRMVLLRYWPRHLPSSASDDQITRMSQRPMQATSCAGCSNCNTHIALRWHSLPADAGTSTFTPPSSSCRDLSRDRSNPPTDSRCPLS